MKQSIILVFVDGLGLGPQSEHNPLTTPGLNLLANFSPPGWNPPEGGGRPDALPEVHRDRPLPAGVRVIATDASLGFPGLPQSATGQTTLFTGINAAEAVDGNHITGFPTFTLRKLLIKHSILKTLKERGHSPVFLNAFSSRFFEEWDAVWKRGFLSASSWANRAAGLPFKNFEDLAAGKAILHDITHDTMSRSAWVKPEEVPPPRTPEESGAILAAAGEEHDFVLFEFFLSDKAGHEQDFDWAVHELLKLEGFLAGALDHLDPGRHTLVVASDHGNVEDLSTKTHTVNPIPTILYGASSEALAPALTRLEAFTPGILRTLQG